MKTLSILMATAILGALSIPAVATEEAEYRVLKQDKQFEIRLYSSHIVAETVIEESFEDAGSEAFNRLFGYISGDNTASGKISMTAPVSQTRSGEKIAMTAPVSQSTTAQGWSVSFMMPSSFTMETLPTPTDTRIELRQVPAQTIASVRYSGTWSEANYRENRASLDAWIKKQGLAITGEAIWARYNAPFTPWFLRRNEILIPVAMPDQS